ncbi:MAG: hypothetical protein J6C82_05055 [Clostridia bacterium]|nr:hypothetical protein [Clostridia bacterium]
MNVAEYIRKSISMNDICVKYNFTPDRAGFISCPFHAEKTASLKIFSNDRGWHCFGCNQGGSVIDFVKLLFSVDFCEAVRIINRDFCLGIPTSKKAGYREREIIRKKMYEMERVRSENAHQREKELAEYESLLDEYIVCDLIVRFLKPKSPDEEISNIYAKAANRMPIVEFRLDCIKG